MDKSSPPITTNGGHWVKWFLCIHMIFQSELKVFWKIKKFTKYAVTGDRYSFIVLWDTDILNICVKLNGFIGPYQIWLRNGSIISSPPPPPSCWDPHCSWRSPLHSGGLGCNWEDRMWDDPLQGDGIIVDSRYSPLFLSSAILSPFRSKLVRSSARVAARGYPLLHLGDLPLQPGGWGCTRRGSHALTVRGTRGAPGWEVVGNWGGRHYQAPPCERFRYWLFWYR